MNIEKSIFAKEEVTKAIQLAKDITWFIKQRDRLGPFSTKDGWYVANGVCYDCGNLIRGNVYEDRKIALEAADNIIKKMAMDDIELLQQYGPNTWGCETCKERLQRADEIERTYCRSCGGDCGHCSIYGMLEDIFD